MKRRAIVRDWSDARAKVEAERVCRVGAVGWGRSCGECAGPVQAAHVIGREHDRARDGQARLYVAPVDVVPLCARHHRDYDARALDLLPFLTIDEQARAVSVAGGIIAALRRTTNGERSQ